MALRLIDIQSKGRYSERYINHYEVFTEAFVYLNLLVKTCQSNWEHEDFYSFTKHYCAQNESLFWLNRSIMKREFLYLPGRNHPRFDPVTTQLAVVQNEHI